MGQVIANPDAAARYVKVLVEYEWPNLRKSPVSCERFDGQIGLMSSTDGILFEERGQCLIVGVLDRIG